MDLLGDDSTDDGSYDPLALLREHQDGKCAVCEEARTLVVDHDHETMLVRGLLCYRCNMTEGRKDWPWLRAYRENPPAQIIGLSVVYGQHRPKLRSPQVSVHEPAEKYTPQSPLPKAGWLDAMMAAAAEHRQADIPVPRPSWDRDGEDAYRALCEQLGYEPCPDGVSSGMWRSGLEEAGWSYRKGVPSDRHSWRQHCAFRAFVQIARDLAWGEDYIASRAWEAGQSLLRR